ncbi:MAG: hypothetical protein MUE54_10940 [Anaerolineae bacterium]|nr:hypothetical protein [Anaerolineae bacterium]
MTPNSTDTAQFIASLAPMQTEIAQIEADYTASLAELDRQRTSKRIDADNLRLDFTNLRKQVESLAEDIADLREDLDDLGKLPAVQTVANTLSMSFADWHSHVAQLETDFDALKTAIRADEKIATYLDNGGRRGIFSRKPDLDADLITQFLAYDQALVDTLAGLTTFEADGLPAYIEQAKAGVEADYQTGVAQAEADKLAKVEAIRARSSALFDGLGDMSRAWQYNLWEHFIRTAKRATEFPKLLHLGKYIGADAFGVDVPMFIPFQTHKHLIILADDDHFAQAQGLLVSVIMRLVVTLPPNSAKFTLIDTTNGEKLPFDKRLPKDLGGDGLITDADGISDALQAGLHHIRQNGQDILRYDNLTAYNDQAKIPIPYQFICFADLTNGLNPKSAERLETLIERGGKAGVLVLGVMRSSLSVVNMNMLTRESVIIWADANGFSVNGMSFEADTITDKALLGGVLSALRS